MKIVIIGAGAVGHDLAQKISRREHDVVVVERDPEQLRDLQEQLDCHVVAGDGADPSVLEEAGVPGCDLFAAVTDRDEVNIIACLTAQRLGARIRVGRVRGEHYYREGRLFLPGIDLAINPDQEAVHAIRRILFQAAATDIYEFAEGRVRVVGTRVEEDAFVVGKTLLEIHQALGRRVALVTTLVRGEETLIPRGDTVIQKDDRVYLAGERHLIDGSLRYFHTHGERPERVMIVGANAMGLELARDLMAAGIKVKLIDRSEEKCQRAAELLHHALVLHGDGTDRELLASEGVEQTNGFISVSTDEETNIMACLLARYHGAGKTICRVNRPDYVPLLPLIGIDAAVSTRLSTAARIARFVKSGAVVSSESLGFSDSEFLQLHLAPDGRCLGRRLAELSFPREAVIVAVLRAGKIVTPHGDTVLQADDEVFVFALPSALAEVERFFAAD